MFQILALLIALGIHSHEAFAQAPPPESRAQAHSLYTAGKYEEALQVWLAHPEPTAAFHHDLGTTYFRLAKYGLALAHLEKARALAPGNPALRTNLELARTQAARVLGPHRLDPGAFWLESLTAFLSRETLHHVPAVLALLVPLAWLLAYRRRRRVRAALLHPVALTLVGLYVLANGLSVSLRWLDSVPAAMVVQSRVVRSGPSDDYAELGRVDPGMKIRVLGVRDGWRQVRYGAEAIGWVPDATVLLL